MPGVGSAMSRAQKKNEAQNEKLRLQRNLAFAASCKFLNVVYLTVSAYSLQVFPCVTFPDGVSRLEAYPPLECDTTEHNFYRLVRAPPSIALGACLGPWLSVGTGATQHCCSL